MRNNRFVLWCLVVIPMACNQTEKKATTTTDKQADTVAQQTPPRQQPASDRTSSGLSTPNSNTVTSAVDSSGQNYTFSTAGELDIVGNETNYDILLPTDFLFDFDKYELRPEANTLLQKLKKHFATHKASQVHVFGHTDSKGSDQYNAVLSQKRAIAVQKWLKANTGVYAMAAGMGEREPLVPNENADGSDNQKNRQRNRRVTIRVVAYPDVNKMLKKYKS